MRIRPVPPLLVSIASIPLLLWSYSASRIALRAADNTPPAIVALTPEQVHWLTPPYYTDGRQRANLLGDSSQPGPFVDRVKIPGGLRVRAHTHPDIEVDTVIAGTWYVGVGSKFDAALLKPYPAGSFLIIPAGLPHFVASSKGEVIVQISGQGPFRTEYVQK